MTRIQTVLSAALLSTACSPSARSPVGLRAEPLPPGVRVDGLTADAPAHFGISLKLGARPELDALLASLADPASPQFRRWLSPAEFGERFGVPASAYEGITHLLEARGFTVQTSPNRLFIEATGRAADVEEFWDIRLLAVHPSGVAWRTYSGTPSAPAELGPWLQSVHGLDTRPRFFHRLALAGIGNAFGPQDLRRYYDLAALHAQGFVGRGAKIAALGAAPAAAEMPSPDDIGAFYTRASDSSARLIVDAMPNPNNDFYPPGQGVRQELELDSELSTVGAPGAQSVRVVLAPATQMFSTGVNYIVNSLPDLTAVSVSFGGCEQGVSQADAQTTANLIAQGAAEGQAWFIASGDFGVDTCRNGTVSADFPADVPSAVAVGGTQSSEPFDGNGAIVSWGAEAVWNQGAGGGATGGGASVLFTRPSWQTGPGTSTANVRELPDLAILGASSPGIAVDVTSPGQLVPSGGTSLSAPLAAGFFAAVNDFIGGCGIGNPGPALYALGAAQQDGGAPVFHDITSGNISFNNVTGPAAGPGYDEASGWGSLDVARLAAAWPACDGGAVDAGPRVPYDPCGTIACDGGAVCSTQVEGPAQCVLPCDGGTSCPPNEICGSLSGFAGGACVPGCHTTADCATGRVCSGCQSVCVPTGPPTAQIGDACVSDTDCPTGGFCLTAQDGFPGGYCSQPCDPLVPACRCATGASCDNKFCLHACSISQNAGCRVGYACDDPQTPGDTGFCVTVCQQDSDCHFINPNLSCHTATGQCLGPGRVVNGPDAGVDAGVRDAGPPPPVTLPPVGTLLGASPSCGCTGGVDLGGLAAMALLFLTRRLRK